MVGWVLEVTHEADRLVVAEVEDIRWCLLNAVQRLCTVVEG